MPDRFIWPDPLPLSRHARARSQQRSMRPQVIDTIVDHGTCIRVRGADSYAIDKAGRRRLKAELGDRFREVEPWLNAFVVVSDDGRIITVARRTRRLRRR